MKTSIFWVIAIVIVTTIVCYPEVKAEEIRIIPSNWNDMTYSNQQRYQDDDVPQMDDETYSEAVMRQYDLENDTDFTLYNEFGITGED